VFESALCRARGILFPGPIPKSQVYQRHIQHRDPSVYALPSFHHEDDIRAPQALVALASAAKVFPPSGFGGFGGSGFGGSGLPIIYYLLN
jgi:hypothetical protein